MLMLMSILEALNTSQFILWVPITLCFQTFADQATALCINKIIMVESIFTGRFNENTVVLALINRFILNSIFFPKKVLRFPGVIKVFQWWTIGDEICYLVFTNLVKKVIIFSYWFIIIFLLFIKKFLKIYSFLLFIFVFAGHIHN